MKTDDLISLLATDTTPVNRRQSSRQASVVIGLGILVAAFGMQETLHVRPDIALAAHWPGFWMKVLFPLAIAVASFATLVRLARPGARVRATGLAIAMPILVLCGIAVLAYFGAAPQDRDAMLWGRTWRVCTRNIVVIAVPTFVAAFLALRLLAPTRLARAGACAGAFSGAVAATIYAFHCPETGVPFMAVWYLTAIAVVSAIGALLGPRLLRW